MHLPSRMRRWARLLGTAAIAGVFSFAAVAVAPAHAAKSSKTYRSSTGISVSAWWGGYGGNQDGNSI